ncbi:hypothetical protein [Brevifollis gellanilyticus]|uniref:GTPase-associated protein 1 N-terminal domain-containing protein n=1 Tax=Brevifollis gellanilyticus TaxID=748831 RepID=A0A512MB17_9BACT|nr:hypothetical protein [Brevifollis gellanilyticus]GEP43924.1 hypothetical protein BGE01nite_32150 [Brevifollis gellanilyticus]
MASQLIYTSAPRLIEAGRTGFGTVARHRAVSGLLMAAVERVSQFARLSGLSARRVVLSHRIINAGAASYHVFSCIRDAGSDYTGRTNHLAHHLIADAREARAAAEAGLTPVDILRQMRWRTAWSDAPRFFEPDEEVPLTSFRRSPATGAWQNLTKDASNALLPAQAQRCCLLLPGEDGALDLYQESLATIGGTAAWLVTFTTHLEPTDDLAELRWVALSSASPLRQQAEGAVRTTFDLTDPQSLPAPKLSEARASTAFSAASTLRPVMASAAAPASATAAPASPLPPIFAEPKARPSRSPWPFVVTAVLIAAAGIAAFILVPQLPSLSSSPSGAQGGDAVSVARSVDELWQKHRLNLSVTRNWLKAEGSAALLDSHTKALQQLTIAIREPLRMLDIPRPENTQDEFMDMLQNFTSWQRELQRAVRDSAWSGRQPLEILHAAQAASVALDQHWQKLTPAFAMRPEQPDVLRREIHEQVLRTLAHPAAPEGEAHDWLELIDFTRTGENAAWVEHWRAVSKLPAALVQSDRDLLERATKSADAPVWFRQLTQKQLDAALAAAKAPAPAPVMPAAEPAPAKPEEPAQPADGLASTHIRYIVIETPSMPLAKALDALPTLPILPDMQIHIGPAGSAESELVRWKQLGAPGVFRKSFNDSSTLEFRQFRLSKLPDETTATRFIARDGRGVRVLFEVIAFPMASPLVDAWPSSPELTFRDRREGTRTLLDEASSRWLQRIIIAGGAPLRIQHVEDPTRRFQLRDDGRNVAVESEAATAPNGAVNTKLVELDREIESLRQGIRIDDQRRAMIDSGNLAKQQKEDSLRRLDDSLTARQQRLLQLEEDRKAAAPEDTSFLGVPAGIYSLSVGRRRLCEIKILSGP